MESGTGGNDIKRIELELAAVRKDCNRLKIFLIAFGALTALMSGLVIQREFQKLERKLIPVALDSDDKNGFRRHLADLETTKDEYGRILAAMNRQLGEIEQTAIPRIIAYGKFAVDRDAKPFPVVRPVGKITGIKKVFSIPTRTESHIRASSWTSRTKWPRRWRSKRIMPSWRGAKPVSALLPIGTMGTTRSRSICFTKRKESW